MQKEQKRASLCFFGLGNEQGRPRAALWERGGGSVLAALAAQMGIVVGAVLVHPAPVYAAGVTLVGLGVAAIGDVWGQVKRKLGIVFLRVQRSAFIVHQKHFSFEKCGYGQYFPLHRGLCRTKKKMFVVNLA
jgi:hypothetical protein